jgi:hypothetical protein
VVGVVRDAHLRRLDAVDPVVFERLSATTVPRLLLPSTPGLSSSVVAAVQHLDSRIRVRTTPMQEIVYRHLDEARLAAAGKDREDVARKLAIVYPGAVQ